MSTFLWDAIAFGPIHSRRLGNSLGINLLPNERKICSFDCVYCECGWTDRDHTISDNDFLPSTQIVKAIETKIVSCHQNNIAIDSITFAGNGEPTLHPQFAEIIDRLITIRNQYYPDSVITCLSNSTQLHREDVVNALKKIENPILKLDAGTEELFQFINNPTIKITQREIVNHLTNFKGIAIIQTLFVRGRVDNLFYDNTTAENINEWLRNLKMISPKQVMLYSLDRETPYKNLEKVSMEELKEIAKKVQDIGFNTTVY